MRLIQIVDDDEVVRKSTSIMLRSLGYYVQCWVDGASFLKALGISQQIPVALAAWSPAMITLLLGASALFTLEDG